MTTQAVTQTVERDGKTLFEAKTSDVVDLKRLLKAADDIVDEAPVSIGPDGLRILTADPAMVAMIDLLLKPEFFRRIDTIPEKARLFRVDMGELKDRVSEAKKGDEVTLVLRRAPGDQPPLLDVTVRSDGITSTFTIQTTDADEFDIPTSEDLEFTGSALVAVPEFRDAIQKMGESVAVTLLGDRFVLESAVDEQTAHVTFPDTSDHLHAVRLADGPVSATYSTDYLGIVKRLKHTVKRFRVQFGDDFPLKLITDNDRFELVFILAPRIEEE